jgi:hypothetical protein
MSKVIKNVKVDWVWSGDSYSLLGFNIAITPTTSTPDSGAVALTDVGNVRTYTFNNVTLDDAITYTAWVQAIYSGKDSSWINTSDFSISDDGKATIETRMSNIANIWRSSKDPNAIDGGDIYAGSVTADKISAYGLTIYNSNQNNLSSFSVSTTGEVSLSGNLQSFNYSSKNQTGWSITQDGNAILNQATVRGSILLPNAGMTDQNVYRIWAGQSNPYSSWTTTTSSASTVGAKTLTLTSVTNISAGVNQLITIGSEQKMIVNVNTTTKVVTLDSALTIAYSSGTSVTLTLLAPFVVSQDGTVYAKQGNFGGTFSGAVNVGNIHISDIDPNPSSSSVASFVMNTDSETRTVIKLTETNSYIDTPFTIGNDSNQYFLVDNANSLIDINNNMLSFSQFTKNLLSNSAWTTDATGWSYNATYVSRDTSITLNSYPTYKTIASGLSADAWYGMAQVLPLTIATGDIYSGGVWTYTDDTTSFGGLGAYLQIHYRDSSHTRIQTDSVQITPSTNSTWQYFNITTTPAPANAVEIEFTFWVKRNGRLWYCHPQLEKGNASTAWGVRLVEQKDITIPNRIDDRYMRFKGNSFNFDLKILSGQTDNTFHFQSNSSATTDFKFAKENTSNSVNVLMDGSLEITNLLKMGKLVIQKKTDSGNQGIDFIFT